MNKFISITTLALVSSPVFAKYRILSRTPVEWNIQANLGSGVSCSDGRHSSYRPEAIISIHLQKVKTPTGHPIPYNMFKIDSISHFGNSLYCKNLNVPFNEVWKMKGLREIYVAYNPEYQDQRCRKVMYENLRMAIQGTNIEFSGSRDILYEYGPLEECF